MNKTMTLSIITPESPIWEGPVESVVVPAFEGQMGILPGHAPLVAQLTEGVLRFEVDEKPQFLSLSGGFLEVTKGKVYVFAETAELSEKIDAERARQAAGKAKALMHEPNLPYDSTQYSELEASLKRAMVRLRAVEMAGRRSQRQNKTN